MCRTISSDGIEKREQFWMNCLNDRGKKLDVGYRDDY